MMFDNGAHSADPYAEAPYNPPPARPDSRNGGSIAPRGRSRSRSPVQRNRSPRRYSPPPRRRSPPPRPRGAPSATPSAVIGVFGLSIRTQERDLDEEFGRYGRVEKVTIVYDQRTDRSRGFGFVRMSTVEEATQCVQELNGLELNGRRIRVDYSTTEKPHAPTPGEYMGYRHGTEDALNTKTGADPTAPRIMMAMDGIAIMGAIIAMVGTGATGIMAGVSIGTANTGTETIEIAAPRGALLLPVVGAATAAHPLVVLDPALRVAKRLRLSAATSLTAVAAVDRTVLVHVKSFNDPAVLLVAPANLQDRLLECDIFQTQAMNIRKDVIRFKCKLCIVQLQILQERSKRM
ncbi:hypothetical protein FRC07_003736 [Ceratobasidium sp. 392]|nr:hypothetical protein FRC07_003736 [Ceratobasidium sp. 392]